MSTGTRASTKEAYVNNMWYNMKCQDDGAEQSPVAEVH